MDDLPPRVGEAYHRMMTAGSRKNRAASGNLREQVIHNLPTPTVSDTFTDNMQSTQQSEGSMHSVTLAQIVHRHDLLRTPAVIDATGGAKNADVASSKKNHVKLQDQMVTLAGQNGLKVAPSLLPTPISSDGTGGPKNIEGSEFSPQLRDVTQLLPSLNTWGKYSDAIARWEKVLGRPAPSPTKADGKDGTHRLNSEFTEWMMGLPEGWVTGVGLSRNEELKACGNGVVPQQAKLALQILLDGVKW